MTEAQSKVERAVGAMRSDVWSELQHRRVAKRLDEALEGPQRSSRWRLVGVGGAVVAAAVATLLFFRSGSAPSDAAGSAQAGQHQTARTVLADGSMVDVDRGGQIRVLSDRPEETRVEVVAGRAEFEVQKRPGRPFITSVRGVEVRVVGTHFSTELDERRPPGVVRVVVSRGTVEVLAHQGAPLARLNAGDKLEISLGAAAAEGTPAVVGAPSSSATEPGASVVRPAAPPPDASKLFELARDARRSDDIAGAVRAYATLLKQFPNDERVGVAALELGRLRMDAQHAYGPAAEAFRRAFVAAPNEGIREDALARLVEAVDAVHDQKTCLAEQRRYQARYPGGVHAASVRARCVAP